MSRLKRSFEERRQKAIVRMARMVKMIIYELGGSVRPIGRSEIEEYLAKQDTEEAPIPMQWRSGSWLSAALTRANKLGWIHKTGPSRGRGSGWMA